MNAVISKDFKLIEYLIKNKVDLDLKDNFGLTALAYACMLGEKNIIILLLKNGIDVNTKDFYGNNSLIYSMHSDNIYLIEDLVRYGIDINNSNLKNETPITKAFNEMKKNISLYLLKNGAKLNFKNGNINELNFIKNDEFKKQILEIIKENSNIIKFNDVPKQSDLNKFFNK